jgi:ABC-type spermidine/putrescine transport system permease subunit II
VRRIVVPQILPSLIAAWLFAFIGSFDEVVITNFLVTAGHVPTLAVFVFNQIDSSASPAIAASAVVMATVAVITAIAVTNLDARRQKA